MSKHKSRVTASILLCVGTGSVMVGCKDDWREMLGLDEPAEPSKTTSSAIESLRTPSKGTTPTARAHMQEHLDRTQQLRRSVQDGDLESAREMAVWLADHELSPNLADSWRPHVNAMQKSAQSVRDARTIADAAAAVGMLGEACAGCHRELSAPVTVPDSSPPSGSGIEAQMRLHAWAVEQMWRGLITPSDAAWVRGAEAMAKAELTPDQIFADRSPSPGLLDLERQARDVANQARGVATVATGDTRRGQQYGVLITTCNACHAEVKASR